MAKRSEKVQVSLSPDEIELIDNWQFENRIPTRAAAIRELIGRSITSGARSVEDTLRSRDIGVAESKLIRQGKPSFSVADAEAPDTPLIYVSEGFTELCGYTREDAVGRNCRFLQGPNTDKKKAAAIRSALEKGKNIEIELINYRKSGDAYKVRLCIEPIFEPGSKRPKIFIGVQTFLGDL